MRSARLAVVGYSPFGYGNFPARDPPGGRVLADIAAATTQRRGRSRSPSSRPRAFVIPKASTPEHAAENAGAGDLKLSENELARIDTAFPRGPKPAALPMI